jgi:hypothetical protein
MKKEEFPTFLNEQPTVVFGRTTRELLVILIGLTGAYLVWTNMGLFLGSGIGALLIKGLFSTVPVIGSIIVAFIKIASRPLEEWAAIGVFYFLTPKVYLYMPLEELGESDSTNSTQYQLSKPGQGDEDDF